MMSSPGPVSPLVLSLRGVSKAFGVVQALRDVSVDCGAGEIHALVGENGSGKSTLLGIASGFVAADEGVVEIDGRRTRRGSPPEARKLGLGIAYQTYSHVLDLSVAENLSLAVPADEQPGRRGVVAWAAARLAEFKLDVPVTAPAGSLSLAERQLLEVVKALLARPKVLLLDEPTTALGPNEVAQLHALVHEQAEAGIGIVYVSHRLPEVLDIADRVTVLRDGVSQGTFEAASMSEESLIALMIGRPLEHAFPERSAADVERKTMLAVSGLRGDSFGPIDLEVGGGEILGIAGAEGNGQVQFLRALAGVEPASGSASCDGQELDTRSPVGPLRAGVVLLSGDRSRESLFPVLSVRANTTIQVLRPLGRFGVPSPAGSSQVPPRRTGPPPLVSWLKTLSSSARSAKASSASPSCVPTTTSTKKRPSRIGRPGKWRSTRSSVAGRSRTPSVLWEPSAAPLESRIPTVTRPSSSPSSA